MTRFLFLGGDRGFWHTEDGFEIYLSIQVGWRGEVEDYARRANTIGSLRQADVSRTITAPAVLAQSGAPTVIVQENKALRDTLARLNERLNEPFVTVNTVTGDLGIKQAQDDYQRLVNNKSPKNKRR